MRKPVLLVGGFALPPVDLARPVPVPWTAIWSPIDRIVPDGRAAAPNLVEVRASHVGVAVGAAGRAAIAEAVRG